MGSPAHRIIPGCKWGGPKKPEAPNSRRRSPFCNRAAEPVSRLWPVSLTASFAALCTQDNYFVVLHCTDLRRESEGTLVHRRNKLVSLVTSGHRGDRQAGGRLAAARGQEQGSQECCGVVPTGWTHRGGGVGATACTETHSAHGMCSLTGCGACILGCAQTGEPVNAAGCSSGKGLSEARPEEPLGPAHMWSLWLTFIWLK